MHKIEQTLEWQRKKASKKDRKPRAYKVKNKKKDKWS